MLCMKDKQANQVLISGNGNCVKLKIIHRKGDVIN